MSVTTSCRTRHMAMSSARPSPRAGSPPWTWRGAKAAPGVLAIVTAENAGKLGKGNFNTAKLLGGPEIDHYHQAIAVVVAETFEQARAAAQLVRVNYAGATGKYRPRSREGHRQARPRIWRPGRHRRRRLRTARSPRRRCSSMRPTRRPISRTR